MVVNLLFGSWANYNKKIRPIFEKTTDKSLYAQWWDNRKVPKRMHSHDMAETGKTNGITGDKIVKPIRPSVWLQ